VHGNYREDGDVLRVCVGGDSGDVLSLAALGDGALSISRPGPQHDEWRSLGFNLSGIFQRTNVSQMAPSVKWKII